MELRQLKYFVAVAEEGGFVKAATRVRVAQPAITVQIRQLEQELGTRLLDRSHHTVRLTDAGRGVLPHAIAALQEAAAIRDVTEALTGLLTGRVKVGTVVSCTSSVVNLPEILAGFHRRYPRIQVTLAEDNSRSLISALAAGDLDLALVSSDCRQLPKDVQARIVDDEALVAVAAKTSPLNGRETMTIAELARHDVICTPVGTGIRVSLDEACAAAGVTLQVVFDATDIRTLVHLAAGELGVAVLPPSALDMAQLDTLQQIAITDPEPRTRLALAWGTAAEHGAAGRALIDYVGAPESARFGRFE